MLTPYGQPAQRIEKLMLLAMWANFLATEQTNSEGFSEQFIFAGVGKPTYPIHHRTASAYKKYWGRMEKLALQWHGDSDFDDDCAIDYGNPFGDLQAKTIMAQAMSRWYETAITPCNVLFTVGGIGGLNLIFEVLNDFNPDSYRVITPFPHYTAYNNSHHILHPIDVMKEAGYQLTAVALENSIKEAYCLARKDNAYPKAVVVCNPSNPLGTIIHEDEIKKIAEVLRKHPDLYLILDEAYAEMNFIAMPSFIKIAPDLKKRTLILRTATKALSAAGERMAILLAFDAHLINELVRHKITTYLHAPRSAQIAYAETMLAFNDEDRLKMSSYYQQKVDYVIKRLHAMGAAMPDERYKVEGTFYALGDFSDLFGMEMPDEAKRALPEASIIQTGEDLVYSLLFKDSIMVAPLSYFGMSKDCGYIRLTCSGKDNQLIALMDRLENRLKQARLFKSKPIHLSRSTIQSAKNNPPTLL